MPEVYLRTVGSSITGHPGLTPDAGCWGKGGPGWPGSHPLFIPQQPNRGHRASTAPPSVSLPGVRSVRGITGSQRGAGTNPNLRPIRDAVVWRKCPATSVELCKEGRDGAVEVNLRFQSVLGNRARYLWTPWELRTGVKTPICGCVIIISGVCISDSPLTSYHDFILKFESLNLSHYLHGLRLPFHDDREKDKIINIFLENQQKFMTQIISP